jgi:hypothetical protein
MESEQRRYYQSGKPQLKSVAVGLPANPAYRSFRTRASIAQQIRTRIRNQPRTPKFLATTRARQKFRSSGLLYRLSYRPSMESEPRTYYQFGRPQLESVTSAR